MPLAGRFLGPALLSAAALTLLALPTRATTWSVPDPVLTLADALTAAAAGDSIVIACGTYVEADLVMRSGVVLRSETGRPDCVTLDAQDLMGHLFAEQCDSTTVLEGITFTRGWGTYTDQLGAWGGALRAESSHLLLRHCDFVDNDAVYGGGVYVSQGSLRMEHCRFESNHATGDGAMTISEATAVIDSSVFAQNVSFEGSGAVWGGFRTTLVVRDCAFVGNVTREEGGALTSRAGGLLVERCHFGSNESTYLGGAIAVWEPWSRIVDSRFEANRSGESGGAITFGGGDHEISDCVFVGNVAAGTGGAIRWYASDTTPSSLTASTFHANEAVLGGAALAVSNLAHLEAHRSLLTFGSGGGAVQVDPGAAVVFSCTDIFGNAGGDWTGPIAGQASTAGNFSADPRFCDAAAGDLTLRDWSPCLPRYSPCGEQVGALGLGCEATDAPPTSPAKTRLLPAYPNPFNPRVTIAFELARPAHLRLTIHDARGRCVATLLDGRRPVGRGEIAWDGTDDAGASVGSSVYFVRMTVDGDRSWRRRIVLVR